MATATDVYLTARELIGTPFQHQGRKKGVGIDCAGVPIYVLNRLNITDFNVFDYPRLPNGRMLEIIEQNCQKISLQTGALVVYRVSTQPQHVGIVSEYRGDLGLIHAWDIAKEVVEHRLPEEWNSRLIGYYSLPGVHYDN